MINYQNNNESDKIESRVELKIELSKNQGLKFLPPLSKLESEELTHKIDQNPHKIIYLASPLDHNLRFTGGIYDI